MKGMVRALVVGGCLAAMLACHKDASRQPAPKVPDSPVPAPDGLVADAVVRGPDGLWVALRDGVAGPLARLPQTAAGALAAVADLDVSIAGEIDGAAPAYAVLARPGAAFGWVVAMKVRDLPHARTTLLEGKAPRFTGHETGGGYTVLAPATPAPAAGHVLALSPLGYVLVARSEADVVTLAPYATRTLPARPAPAHAVVVSATHAALVGPVHDQLVGALGGQLRS
jgi:hypothetical protein